MYVGPESDDRMEVLDTASNKIIANIPIGQAPQPVVSHSKQILRAPKALQILHIAGQASHVSLVTPGQTDHAATCPLTSVTLFDLGLIQVLEAAVTGLSPDEDYVLGLA